MRARLCVNLSTTRDVAFVQHHHHHWSSAVHACQPTATELFPVAVAHVWNGLPQHVTTAPSLSTFRSCLKTHLFQRCSFPWLLCVVTEQCTDTLIARVIMLLTNDAGDHSNIHRSYAGYLHKPESSHTICHCHWTAGYLHAGF